MADRAKEHYVGAGIIVEYIIKFGRYTGATMMFPFRTTFTKKAMTTF